MIYDFLKIARTRGWDRGIGTMTIEAQECADEGLERPDRPLMSSYEFTTGLLLDCEE
jgi:hypothetical protein